MKQHAMNGIKSNGDEARRQFILRRGVLGYGFSMALIFPLGFSWLWGYPFLPTLAGAILVFPVCGYLWGALMWKWGARSRH